jgi:Dolichyl-phosphate-mannose-protein mannosyltransferase
MKRAAAPALLALFFLQSFCASLLKSTTFDEPAHLASGVSYLSTRVFHANLQHPPLLKELSAASAMLFAGVRWPESPEAQTLIANPPGMSGLEWAVGNAILARNPDRILFWARLPMILIATLLGLLIYLWGRQILGETAALGALFLYALDPTMVAHSYLVTTDVGLAAFTVAFLMALWNYVERPSGRGLVWCGLALGAALASKYSAVFLVPIALALLLATRGRRAVGPFLVVCAVASLVIDATFLLHSPLKLYLQGIARVNADHDPNYQVFFAGEFGKRFYSYFAGAWLLKEPLAAIVAACVGVVAIVRSKHRLFLLLPPVVLFLAYSAKADNLGVRYLIPVLPFAYLAGGAGLAWLVGRRPVWAHGAAALLCGWLVLQAAAIYPDHLSYFNESACLFWDPAQVGLDGGTRCGPRWLDDSNVDWGQGLKQLRGWLDSHAIREPIRFAYFGSFPPQNYGIQFTQPAVSAQPAPGVYAVSAHFLPRAAAAGTWFSSTEPTAIVGHAIYVYVVK